MLDINTRKGQMSLAQEQELIASIETQFSGYVIVQTPKKKSADVDGFLCRDGEIVGVVENKCRDMTLADLRGRFRNEWLVTYEKLVKGAAVARSLCVPFIGYLFLVPDRLALAVRIADSDGAFMPRIRLERTETQATTNGGVAIRTNAYIDMRDAKEFAVK